MEQEQKATPLRIATVKIDDVRPHPRNPRQGDVGAIAASMERFGFYQPIVVQRSSGYILAGNHRWKAAQALGRKTIPVVYQDVGDEEALAILVADNRTSDLASYDDRALAELLQEIAREEERGGLLGTGFDTEDVDRLLADLETPLHPGTPEYTTRIESPLYEPQGPEPPVSALVDVTAAVELTAAIDAAEGIPDDVRAFLRTAAGRHIRFDYEAIAEWYVHQPPEVQALVEQSALVIIDFKQAVERGFIRLNDDLEAAFRGDYPDA